MERECIDLKTFVESDEGIIIEFHIIHFEALILGSVKPRDIVWPKLRSNSIFGTKVDSKCCPMCFKLTCTNEPNCVECILCKLWVRSEPRTSCVKCWTDEDLEDLSPDENFYYCTCIDKLIELQKSAKETCSIKNIINCLRSFNLDGVSI